MALILLVLILAILFGGLGFLLHALWWIAAIVLVVWLVGFAFGPARAAAGTAGNQAPPPHPERGRVIPAQPPERCGETSRAAPACCPTSRQNPAVDGLVRHLRDARGHGARRAKRHVLIAEPPGQHRAAVAHVPVLRMRRAARALAGAQFPASAARAASSAARTAGSSFSMASEVADDTWSRHSPSAVMAVCHAAASCLFGFS